MLAFAGFRIADVLMRLLPLAGARSLAVALARLAFHARVPARARAIANFRRLLGERPRVELEALARRAFEHFALTLVDFLRLGRLDSEAVRREVQVVGREHLEGAHRSGRGVILLSVHTGNWEWGAALLSGLGLNLHLAARRHGGAALERWFAARRARHRLARLDARPLWPAAARALRRHEWVALMGDRVPPGERDAACAWAAAVARRTGALILPALVLRREEGGYLACFEAPLTPHECLAGGFRRVMRRHLEREPAQWLAFEPLPEGLA